MADVLVRNEGSVVMFNPKSAEAKAWVKENLDLESWQWMGNAFAVEWRYAPDVAEGMMGDGLEIAPELEFPTITEEEKDWLLELGVTRGWWNEGFKPLEASAKKAAVPFVPLRQETQPNTPNVPGAPPIPLPVPNPATPPPPAEEPQQQEKHTVPPELPNALFHMAGRGGWHRVSMNTVQSDDKRFTITKIDPTRRSKWFLLKDLETGLAYEEDTMTGAKKKSLQIRAREGKDSYTHEDGSPDYSIAGEPPVGPVYTPSEHVAGMPGGYKNPLLQQKSEI